MKALAPFARRAPARLARACAASALLAFAGLALGLGAGCSSVADAHDVCTEREAKVEAMQAKLKCTAKSDQAAVCENAFMAQPDCEKEITAVIECANEAPDSDWECTDMGADVKGTSCLDQLDELTVCEYNNAG